MIKWMAQGAIRIFPFSAPGVVNGHRSTSSVDRGAMRKLLVVIASLASFVLSACERTSIAPDEGVSASIEMPRGLGTSRAIEQNRLLLDAFVGTERLQFSRDGRIHRGRFELEDNRSYQLTVRFSYRARGRARRSSLPRSNHVRSVWRWSRGRSGFARRTTSATSTKTTMASSTSTKCPQEQTRWTTRTPKCGRRSIHLPT